MRRLAWARRATIGLLLVLGVAAALAASAGATSSHRSTTAHGAAGTLRNRIFASGAVISHDDPQGAPEALGAR